ncbi:unnamed protein product [Calicophoron daubneyi]|uniref:SAM domain-containing protein n=1 Tax=Calicophoron daubneyi TaxID=300641 RepID=A0AAV2TTX9_CALDB
MNRATAGVTDLSDRNQAAAHGIAAKYRPLLANNDGPRKRVSDPIPDGIQKAHPNVGQIETSYVNGRAGQVGRPRKQRTLDPDLSGTTVHPKDRESRTVVTPNKAAGPFEWTAYLKEVGASAAPASLFFHLPLDIQNECRSVQTNVHNVHPASFKPGQYLEGIDPHHESLFCVLKVIEVVGRRLRLRFVGYPEKYDFWSTVDSPFLFPVGWCAHNKRHLQPPKTYLDRDQTEFSWDSFLGNGKSSVVPRNLFTVPWDCPIDESPAHMFRIGCKLEAVDKRNPTIACVATVKDCVKDYLLIHFDGWDSGFDQWAHISSELLHPVGYCEEQELVLSIPSDWSTRPTGFTWKQYLKETNSKPVPKEAFDKVAKTKASEHFQVGQRLEAVDKRCPQLIRVANVVATAPIGFVTLGYDGWTEKYNICVEASSLDLYPVGYCQVTGHPLQPPPGYDTEEVNGVTGDSQSNSSASSLSGSALQTPGCSTPGCKGYGHVKGPRYSTHQRVSGCPYAECNLKRDLIRAHERLSYSNIVPNVPDSTSLSQMPKLVQASGTNSFISACSAQELTSAQCLSPDSSSKSDPFPLACTTHAVVTTAQCSFPTSHVSSSPKCEQNNCTIPKSPLAPVLTVTTNTSPPSSINSKSNTSMNYQEAQSSDSSVLTAVTEPAVSPNPPLTAPLDLSLERNKKDGYITDQKSSGAHCASTFDWPGSPARELKQGAGEAMDTAPTDAKPTMNSGIVSSCVDFSPVSVPSTPNYQTFPSNAAEPPRAVSRRSTAGAKRSASALKSEYKQLNQEVKPYPRLAQIANAANEYARQQQPFGVTNLPIKRKRGRPRKYTTLHMIHSSPHHSRPVQFTTTPTLSQSRSTMPQNPYSYPAVLLGQQHGQVSSAVSVPSISNSVTAPTLSLYTPLNVGPTQAAPALYPAGVLFTGNTLSQSAEFSYVNGTAVSSTVSLPLTPSSSAVSSASNCSAFNTNMGVVSTHHTTNASETPKFSTPCEHLPPPQITPDIQSTSSMNFSCNMTSLGQSSSSLDFCSAHTLNGLGTCLNSIVGPTVLTNAVTNTLITPSQKASENTYTRWSPTLVDASLVPVNSVLPGISSQLPFDVRQSGVTAHPEPYASASNWISNNSQTFSLPSTSGLDLMGRLLPQANAALRAAKIAGLPGPHSWNVEMVGNFVSTLPGCKHFACKFTENEIDGAALLCLEQHDLMQILGMKLGPAVKVFSAIQALRRSLMATPIAELGPEHTDAMAAAASCFTSKVLSPIPLVSLSHGVKGADVGPSLPSSDGSSEHSADQMNASIRHSITADKSRKIAVPSSQKSILGEGSISPPS